MPVNMWCTDEKINTYKPTVDEPSLVNLNR